MTKPILEARQKWLYCFRKKNGKPLGDPAKRHRLTLTKGFVRWLARSRMILEVHPQHVVPPHGGVIFLTEQGKKLSLGHITERTRWRRRCSRAAPDPRDPGDARHRSRRRRLTRGSASST